MHNATDTLCYRSRHEARKEKRHQRGVATRHIATHEWADRRTGVSDPDEATSRRITLYPYLHSYHPIPPYTTLHHPVPPPCTTLHHPAHPTPPHTTLYHHPVPPYVAVYHPYTTSIPCAADHRGHRGDIHKHELRRISHEVCLLTPTP